MNRPWTAVDFQVSDVTSAYLKNLAANGDPNAQGLPHWSRVNAASPSTLQLGEKTGMMPLATPTRLAFWKKYFASPEAAHAPFF